MVSRLLAAASAICVSFCGSAHAGEYDTTTLFTRGAWTVDLTYDSTDRTTWCVAETNNRRGQTFSVVAHENGVAAVFVFDPSWTLARRSVRYRIDIDYDRWTIDGTANDMGVSVTLNGNASAERFLGQLMLASAVATYNEDGMRLATFSLDGSRSAIGALFECWGRIRHDAPDPRRADPFIRAADPF